jgi:uncharacterized membrane protein YjdF
MCTTLKRKFLPYCKQEICICVRVALRRQLPGDLKHAWISYVFMIPVVMLISVVGSFTGKRHTLPTLQYQLLDILLAISIILRVFFFYQVQPTLEELEKWSWSTPRAIRGVASSARPMANRSIARWLANHQSEPSPPHWVLFTPRRITAIACAGRPKLFSLTLGPQILGR